jgi:hypothetical protein
MDETVVAEKLESLRRCIRRIEAKRPATVAERETDADLQDILSLHLSHGRSATTAQRTTRTTTRSTSPRTCRRPTCRRRRGHAAIG